MTNLPPDISLDFAATDKNLWVVWVQAPQDQIDSGWAEPVYHRFGLASEGEAGLLELQKGWGEEFLAAVPFSHIRATRSMLRETSKSSLASLWPSWLPPIKAASFFLKKTEGGQFVWGFGEAGESDLSQETLLEGRISDLDGVFQEGERILKESDYKAIGSDTRPVSPGHPRNWLLYMQDPVRWMFMEEMTKEYE